MEEYQHNDNGEHGLTRVHEFAERSDAQGADGEELHRDEGRVGTFDAKTEELGDAPGTGGKGPRKNHEQGRAGKFDANAEELGGKVQTLGDIGHIADFYVYAWQRQLVDFYCMRLRKNVEFGRRLSEVDGIADVIGAQREYVRGTLLDYASSFCSLYGFGLRGPQQTSERPNR